MADTAVARRQTRPGDPDAAHQFTSFRTVNFYAGNQLSRMSWLRNSSEFLNAALTSSRTRFVLLDHLNPLVYSGGSAGRDKDGMLATLAWADVKDTVVTALPGGKARQHIQVNGQDEPVVFGPQAHGLGLGESANDDTHKAFEKQTQGIGPPTLALVFLGVDEAALAQESMPGQLAKAEGSEKTTAEEGAVPAGTPYFALSLSYRPPGVQTSSELPTEKLSRTLTADGKHDFVDTRALAQAGTWPLHDAAVVAEARSLMDWNERQKVRIMAAVSAGNGRCTNFLSTLQRPHLLPRCSSTVLPCVQPPPV